MRVLRRRAAAVVALAAAAFLALGSPAAARNKFDTQLLAHVGSPGYPGLSLVGPDRTIYVGTFTNAMGSDTGPSKVFAYSPTGQLLRTYTIMGQTPGAAHGVQVAARDAHGLLYLLDQNPPRVLTLDPRTGAQATYGTFRDVMPCVPATPPADCSDTVMDNPPEPDYAAWGPDGTLYVTDYQQAVIWRVPPGGGAAHVWFTDPQIDGSMFGPAGIVLMPDHRTLMFDTSGGGVTTPGNPLTGQLYTLGIQANGRPGTLHQIWESGPKEAPDGFALAQSGNVYMALVGPATNQLVELSPAGTELGRFPSDTSGNNGTSVPFDEPSSVQFDGQRMIVTNDAFFSGDPSHFALFDVWAGEPGAPLFVPGLPSGGGGGGAGAGAYRLTVKPRVADLGDEYDFRFHATLSGRSLRGALVRFVGETVRTNGQGNATIDATLRRAKRYTARLTRGSSSKTLARAIVRAVRR